MTQVPIPDGTAAHSPPPSLAATRPTSAHVAWLALVALLLTNAPLFVCMPLTNDTALLDVVARDLSLGGVLYRDTLEPNFPGVVWWHLAVRSLLGWSSEAMRSVDLTLFGIAVLLLTRWGRIVGRSSVRQTWTAVVLLLFYFSISEWNHCQRDIWLLPLALTALHMRRVQVARVLRAESAIWPMTALAAWGFLEGACWAAGAWVKPHLVIPAAAAWVVGARRMCRWAPISTDMLSLLAGGLVVGGAGLLWLQVTGALPFFLDTLAHWTPRYVAAAKEQWSGLGFLGMMYRYFPWFCVHLAAIPPAVSAVFVGLHGSRHAVGSTRARREGDRALLAVFYLAWLAQALFLQHLFDYVYAPTVALAIGFVAAELPERSQARWNPAGLAFLALATLFSPAIRPSRLACWWTCVTRGSTPEIRDRLRLLAAPSFRDLERVASFLERQGARSGDVLCFNDNLVHLYTRLGFPPPTRFVYLDVLLTYFSDRRPLLYAALAEIHQRYVVVDLVAGGLSADEAAALAEDAASPAKLYPWSHPIVFRSGDYVVYEIHGSLGRLCWPAPRPAIRPPAVTHPEAPSTLVDTCQ